MVPKKNKALLEGERNIRLTLFLSMMWYFQAPVEVYYAVVSLLSHPFEHVEHQASSRTGMRGGDLAKKNCFQI
jgi:hypothetical protein